jgi:large subunit ribosomal protein L4
MPKVKQFNLAGKEIGQIDLPEGAFGVKPNRHVLWQSVQIYLGNQRQGTAATKTRSLVSGGGRKPWRQKGTGRARSGSNRSPVWVGGSTVFGPQPRDYSTKLPRKVRRLALASALSQRAQEGNVAVVDGFRFDEPKTSRVASFMKAAGFGGRKVCFITREAETGVILSCRNLPGVAVLPHSALNVYDLLNAEVLVLTTEAVEGLREAYGS